MSKDVALSPAEFVDVLDAIQTSHSLPDLLAAERRATVERLRAMFAAQMTNPAARWCSADEITAILDEEGRP